MNMISTGAFLNEMDASNKQPTVAEKFAAVWEKKNTKAARAGGVSLMALSLAACGSSSTTTTSTDTSTDTTTTTPTAVSAQATTGVDALVGGAGDDSFSAQMDATATLNTAGLLDSFAGGEGTDTLYVTNTTANAVSTQITAGNITGVEKFVYSASAGGDLDFDTAGSATQFEFTILGASDLSDVSTTDTVTITNGGAAMDTTLTYKATSVANAADAHTIALTSVTAGADLAIAGALESLTLDVNGASSFADLDLSGSTTSVTIDAGASLTVTNQLTNAAVTTYTVTGAGTVDLDAVALGAAVTTYNAADATGVQSILAGATNITITTGSADDVVDMAATLNSRDVIDLGAGTDTLRVDLESAGAAAVADLSISNVETLRFDAIGTGAGALQMDNLVVSNIRFDQEATQAAADQVITLTDIAGTITEFNFIGGGELDDDVFFSPVTIDYDVTTDVAAMTLNFSNAGVTADDIRVGAITADNVDLVTINGSDIGAAAADELTIDDLIVDAATDVVVVSAQEVIFSGMDGDVLDTLDMSEATGGSTVQVDDAAAALEVTMGSGNDTFTIADTTVAVTIDLGAGTDLFVSSTLADTITTGAGSDTVRFTGAATDDDNIIVDFTAGAGGDIIDFATSAAAQVTSTAAYLETAGAATLDDGMTVYTGNDLTAITEAAASTAFAAATLVDANTAGDLVYIAASDGVDTGIFLFTDAAGTTAITTAELTLLVTLQGVTDAATLDAANFADFI